MKRSGLENLFGLKLILKRFTESPKAEEFFKNSFWSMFGAVFSKGLLFLSWVIVARILGSDGYGQFGIVRSTVLMFTTFAGFSLGITASKHVAEFLHSDLGKTSRIIAMTMVFGLLMGVIVGSIFYILAPWLAIVSLNAPEVVNELRISAVILLFSAINGAQIGALQGFSAFKEIAKINGIQAILCVPLFIFGALYFGVNGTVWALAISYFIICILSHALLNRECKRKSISPDFRHFWQERRILLSYSFPAFLSGIMVVPVKWYADSILVSRSGFSEMGVFTAALTFNNLILAGAGMLSAPFIAIMARTKQESRNSKFNKFNILAPWAIGAFITSPLLVFPEIGIKIFGDSFPKESFKLTFIFVLLFTNVMMFKQGLGRIMAIYNLQWWSFFSNLFWAGSLIFTFFLWESQNSYFLSLSYLIAYILNTIIVIPIYYKKRIIPERTIDTIESFLIWVVLGLLVGAGLIFDNIMLKSIILLIGLCSMIYLFKKILITSKE